MKKLLLILTMLLLCAALVTAGDEKEPAAKEGAEMMAEQMPEMGAPAELKEMGFMIGDWTVTGKMRMEPTSEEWTPYEGVASYSWMTDGCAMMSSFKSEMFGMPFIGNSIETYDRETGQWQITWLDNMSARQSTYTGGMVDGKMVVKGEDMMAGQTFKTRITVSNMTESSYDWMLEHSMDGGTSWIKFMEAQYAKKM